MFQCLNFARTLGRAVVVEWFKGNSDVTQAVYFWKAKLESVVFRGSKSFQQNQRRSFSRSKLDLRKKALKVEETSAKIRNAAYALGNQYRSML